MPPIKEYKFVHIAIQLGISVMAYSFEQAYERLVKVVKNPDDYEYTSPLPEVS